jgi:uncharacterized protein
MVAVAVGAQSQSVPVKFLLELRGGQIGRADYQFTESKDGFQVKAHYSFSLGGRTAECVRDAELGSDYALHSDTLTVVRDGVNQSASITADVAAAKFNYKAAAGGQETASTFDLHPGTVVMNNFDPSGVQELIFMAAAHPQPDGQYWALLAQGKGVQIAVALTASESEEGTLDGVAVTLNKWHLKLGGVSGDVWADGHGSLMEFSVPVQGFAYRREGFVRKEAAASTPAATAPPQNVDERSVSFVSDGLTFPALLALPKTRQGPVPIVVFVHGSGVHDADETIGPNKPFRDIAWGLAADGVASLRYDKRTYLAPESLAAHEDLDHEVILDAVAALAYASALPEADPGRVFLLGHSLGGMAAPVIVQDRLAQSANSVRGIIFLAGPALPIEQTLLRQLTNMARRREGADGARVDEAGVEEVRKQWLAIFATIDDPKTPSDQTVGQPPLVEPESYWRSLVRQNPSAELAALHMPALVLRGTKDTNVFEEDFQLLSRANTAPGSSSREFDGLSHLFMPVTGEPSARDFTQPAHVAPEVVQQIADWVQSFH